MVLTLTGCWRHRCSLRVSEWPVALTMGLLRVGWLMLLNSKGSGWGAGHGHMDGGQMPGTLQ